jgi:hypothetical protein
MPSDHHQIPLRVDDELFQRIEEYLVRLRKNSPGMDVHRTDAVRRLVIRGLDAEAKARK